MGWLVLILLILFLAALLFPDKSKSKITKGKLPISRIHGGVGKNPEVKK